MVGPPFLLGHLAYVAGMVIDHRSWALTVVAAAGVAAALVAVAPRIVAAVGRTSPSMRGPVLLYMAVISTMVVAAGGRAVAVGVVGAALFYASDATLAWNRFVAAGRVMGLAVMVTYHVAQAGLVLSLVG